MSKPARYKVEAQDTKRNWYPTHKGTLATYSAALAFKASQAYSRILADYSGNGVWQEVLSQRDDLLCRLGTDDRLDAIVSGGCEIVEQARRDAE